MTNAWDAPLYGLVWLAAGLASYVASGWGIFGALYGMVRHLVPPVALAGVLAWPMLATLESAPVAVAPVLTSGSDPTRLLLFWGPLVALLLACVFVIRPAVHRGVLHDHAALRRRRASSPGCSRSVSSGNSGALARAVLGLADAARARARGRRAPSGAAAAAYRAPQRARAAWLGLAGLATLVVFGTELVHLVDVSAGRYNTVFKFWYGAWVLLSVAAGVGVADAASTLAVRGLSAATRVVARGHAAARRAVCAVHARGVVEPRPRGQLRAASMRSPTSTRRAPPRRRRCAGRCTELPRDAVLLEAVGRPYAPTNRVSMATGLPTVIGWPGHEVTWRGSDAGVDRRVDDVTAFYTSGPGARADEVARRYRITHVYLGRDERELYGQDVAARFAGWHTVYRVR